MHVRKIYIAHVPGHSSRGVTGWLGYHTSSSMGRLGEAAMSRIVWEVTFPGMLFQARMSLQHIQQASLQVFAAAHPMRLHSPR